MAHSYPHRRQFEQVYTNHRRVLDRLALPMAWCRRSDVDAAAKSSRPNSALKVGRNLEKIAVRFSPWKVLCRRIDEQGALPGRCRPSMPRSLPPYRGPARRPRCVANSPTTI